MLKSCPLAVMLTCLAAVTGPAFGAPQASSLNLETATRMTDHVVVKQVGEDATSITFQPGAWPHLLFQAPSPWDWSHSGGLQFTITNRSNSAVTFMLRVDDDVNSDGYHHCRSGSAVALPHQTATYTMEYHRDPMAYGVKGLPSAPHTVGITPEGVGSFNPAHIVQFQIFLNHPKHSHTLILSAMHLAPPLSMKATVDKFGQYTGADWPGKIKNTAQLAASRRTEYAWLAAHHTEPDRDSYGGWSSGPTLAKTGFFHTAYYRGKWTLVDPIGHLFLSFGTDCVQDQYSTFLTGRRNWFSSLPAATSPLARFYGKSTAFMGPIKEGTTFDFFRANLYRKYGPNYRKIWFALAIDRLRAWGFNTIGNWSDPASYQAHQMPYVVTIGVPHSTSVSSGSDYWGQMPDPFDPQYAVNATTAIQAAMAPYKNDPWCLGAFVDNELSWAGQGAQGDYGLAIGAMHEAAAESPAKRAFIAQLHNEYATVAAFNAAWGTQFGNWDALNPPYVVPASLSPRAVSDCKAFVKAFADEYFKVISTAFHQADPNHLYLGCRFAWFARDEVKEAAKYCDVVSFNIYQPSISPSSWEWLNALHKPCIIGEFHCGALDRGMWMPGLVLTPNQQARANTFAGYIQSVAENPAFVGCHWFQFVDEPLTGRTWDGENYNIGFLSCTDSPYREMVAAAHKVFAHVYQLRFPTVAAEISKATGTGGLVAKQVSSTSTSMPGTR